MHFQEGPIDLILAAEGPSQEDAESAAAEAFDGLLARLVEELAILRRPIVEPLPIVNGPVARRMVDAVAPFADRFVTPMAAVAGAVADHILAAMVDAAPRLTRAWVNDGGDIAFHLTEGSRFEVGLIPELGAPALAGRTTIGHSDPVRGIATSGRGGRSFSFGIADAVTVLARTAAQADAAATLIANAVDLPDHPNIRRGPANAEDPDSDLGERQVVLGVGPLSSSDVERALNAGADCADMFINQKISVAVILSLQGRWRIIGDPGSPAISPSLEGGKRETE